MKSKSASPPGSNIRVWLKVATLPVIVLLFLGLLAAQRSLLPFSGFAVAKKSLPEPDSREPYYQARFVTRDREQYVHSATVVEISGGKLRAFWVGGPREGSKEGVIYTAVFESDREEWTPETPCMTRATTQGHLYRYIRKLGNTVAIMDERKRLNLFYVSVSIGGWSGSAVNMTVSHDDGATWSPPRRLITSPFLNVSTLVKGPPILFEDGSIGLPVYHEFMGKFGELVRLDPKGNIIHKKRLSWGRHSLQPVVIPSTTLDAIGLMRYAGPSPRRILTLRTADGGRHWTVPSKAELPNPNSALACIRLAQGDLALVFNNSTGGRSDLSLAVSKDEGMTWRIVHTFEKEEGEEKEYSYPCFIQARNGDFHLLYSWHRKEIKHIHFNRAWLEQKL